MSCRRKASAPETAPAASRSSSSFVPCSSVRPKPSSSARTHLSIVSCWARSSRVGGAHQVDDQADVLRQEAVLDADAVALLDRAAHDPAQHVAAVLVGGHDAVGDEEGHRRACGRPGCAARARRARVVARSRPSVMSGTNWSVSKIESDALLDERHAVEAQAGVDVLGRQRRQRPDRILVELHEDEVPVLQEALVLAAGQVVGLAPLQAAVEVELAARPARPGRPGLPEVLLARSRHDPLARDADRLPDRDGLLVGAEAELVVALEDRDPDVLGLEAEALERQLPARTRPRPA